MLAAALICALALFSVPPANAQSDEATGKEPAKDAPEKVVLPEEVAAPEAAARAWVLTDLESGERLAGERDGRRLPIASTTKVMVGLVVLDLASSGAVDLDEEVVVSEEAAFYANPIYSNVGLLAGDSLSVRELLMATMISSGDDAVYALAEHLGGGEGDAGVDRFVEKMNEKAAKRGLKDSHFTNPIGLDAKEHYSSASDLARTTQLAFEHPEFRKMVATPYATITTQDREIPLSNTNELLSSYAPTTGVKTGTTPAAGSSLVASAASGDESYVAVFLDSQEDRFDAAVRALEYGFAANENVDLVAEEDSYTTVSVPYRREEKLGLVAGDDVTGLVDADSKVERKVEIKKELPDSAKPGTRLGTVTATVDGERVGESALVARKGYDEASVWERAWYTVSGFFVEE